MAPAPRSSNVADRVVQAWGDAVRTVDEVAAELQVSTDKLRAWMAAVRRAGGEVKSLGAKKFRISPPKGPARQAAPSAASANKRARS